MIFFSGTLDSLLVSYANLCSALLFCIIFSEAFFNMRNFVRSVEVIHNKMLLGCSVKFGGTLEL